jgi:hypothetical protein
MLSSFINNRLQGFFAHSRIMFKRHFLNGRIIQYTVWFQSCFLFLGLEAHPSLYRPFDYSYAACVQCSMKSRFLEKNKEEII